MLISKVISIGDEILIGQIINSNAAFISSRLYTIGIPVKRIVSIPDREEELLLELTDSVENFDVTIITGGLGPTHDDITKPVLTKFFEDELITDEEVLEHINDLFKKRNIKMPESNEEQATVPRNSKIIWNDIGTAPGLWFEKDDHVVIALPGVPFEMKTMIDKIVLPMLKEKFALKINYVLKSRSLLTTGISESGLQELIGDVSEFIGDSKLAFLPSPKGVRLRIDVKANDENATDKKISEIERAINKKAGKYIYGTDYDRLEKIVGDLLLKKNITLAVAESCTGGLLSSRITDVSGSSQYYAGGVCSYSNDVKINVLKVSKDTIEKHGAVSEETALEMANGIRSILKTDIGISITGIAGPSGGTDEKPVGLVWIGYSDKTKTYVRKFMFGSIRERNKIRAAQMALQILRKELI